MILLCGVRQPTSFFLDDQEWGKLKSAWALSISAADLGKKWLLLLKGRVAVGSRVVSTRSRGRHVC